MKKLICFICAIVLVLSLTACQTMSPTQPGSVLPKDNTIRTLVGKDDTNRFILVDEGTDFNGLHCKIFVDTVTGVMYITASSSSNLGLCPLYNSDGTLILYDEG